MHAEIVYCSQTTWTLLEGGRYPCDDVTLFDVVSYHVSHYPKSMCNSTAKNDLDQLLFYNIVDAKNVCRVGENVIVYLFW